ncbi:uncharacterized protein LOC130587669, partial [Malurus melanocephalus]|uniref:uncharacterized protein LOC130587669 n=1 Tax=Malurus melanocephalus TaxID=175006 RepID=UPI0025477666
VPGSALLSPEQPGSLIMDRSTCRRHCQTVPEAELQKAFSALLMSPEPGALCARLRHSSCELEESELCSVHGAVKELLCPQNGSAVGLTHRNTLKGSLAAVEWIRSHPKITLGVLILLLLLVLALGVSLAVVSGRTQTENPGTPGTPVLLACPHGWVGHRGICYFLSRDQLSWDQAQARCSELGASLAVLKDWEMVREEIWDVWGGQGKPGGLLGRGCSSQWRLLSPSHRLLFPHSAKVDYWLGLRRRGQELQWGDGCLRESGGL